ncbi:uncharacterized protein LOC107846978 isoform X2 [Capsicum annuum]|nr:uncharacterized protein LOC107846978 isoform X2 [Capsicum annuum]
MSIPSMRYGKVASAQTLGHNSKSFPLRDLSNEFKNCLFTNSKQKKGKGILGGLDIPDLSRSSMQHESSRFNTATSQDDSYCLGTPGGHIFPNFNGDSGVQNFENMMNNKCLPDLNVSPMVQDLRSRSPDIRLHRIMPDLNFSLILSESEAGYVDAAMRDDEDEDEDEENNNCEEDNIECEDICNDEYWDISDANYECEYCGAYFWYEERINKHYKSKRPVFNLCCNHGKIKLPNSKEPPPTLK